MLPDLGHTVAFAVPAASGERAAIVRRGPRQLFIVPWRGRSLIGTAYFPCSGDATVPSAGASEVEAFLREVNAAWPGRRFSADEVMLVHQGLLPTLEAAPTAGLQLLRHHRIIDHSADGVPALTAISVKFTTGRRLAEAVVDRVVGNLKRRSPPCRTARTPLPGAGFQSLVGLRQDAERRYGALLPRETLEHLVRTYGSRYERILGYRQALPGWAERPVPGAPVIRAQFLHGALEEMAQRPEDLICRRTELGARGLSTEEATASASEALRSASAPAAARKHMES
jgi:glycerol-3-phosphate dehydrogenase